ncbi:STAS domain-containing protein [Streptomyces sp. PTM05]|uniref:STAS domain-containing protein n=1 Tax=Streptantibioticus parmotrematis TaxID=2873249 RepID=A0ABS7QXZ3_9ACTN|nr:STAS domain-containing protein [Streptantibioticus parmotrematis]MBY8887524.1 STAS domain-containing protein [Streptantibioticus parmotrematis]
MYEDETVRTSSAIRGDDFVLRVQGELDADSCEQFEEALLKATTASGARTVVDLSQMTFADSTVLHLLLAARLAHQRAERPFFLAGPFQLPVERLLEVTGTLGFFPLYVLGTADGV